MARPKKAQPSYLEHKPSGRARVRIDGVDHYLGPYGSKESWNKYYQLMAERVGGGAVVKIAKPTGERMAVGELILAYQEHAKAYYGAKSKEPSRIASAVRPLDLLYGTSPVDEFSPLKLQRVIERLVADGDTREAMREKGYRTISRTTVNDYLQVLKRLFKWGVSQELVRNDIYQALTTVEGIRRGRGKLAEKTHEPRKVRPVPPADIEKTIAKSPPDLATMIRVQLLCGMRPDEMTIMRPCDIDRKAKPCWVYRPSQHKSGWRGHEKEILIGPKAQKLLLPRIKEIGETDYIFSPRRVADKWNKEQREKAGKDPAFVKLNAIKPPRECYDDHSYAQAVRRACRRAKVEEWTPNRLRHNAGTDIRAKFGAEAAKLVLGHRHLNTTEIYAEKDRAKYAKIISKVG